MSRIALTIDGHAYEVEVHGLPHNGNPIKVTIDGQEIEVLLPPHQGNPEGVQWMVVDGRPYEFLYDRDLRWIRSGNGLHQVKIKDLEVQAGIPAGSNGQVKAPIPGQLSEVRVTIGQPVQAGQPLVILEAMKMANEIQAPKDGIVSAIHVSTGETVLRGKVLVEIT